MKSISASEYLDLIKPGKKSKYGNTRTQHADGTWFDSKHECEDYNDLKLMLAAGEISDLQLQVRYALHAVNGTKVCDYIADFVYKRGNLTIVHDSKGMRTDVYKLKKKWFEAGYAPLRILET